MGQNCRAHVVFNRGPRSLTAATPSEASSRLPTAASPAPTAEQAEEKFKKYRQLAAQPGIAPAKAGKYRQKAQYYSLRAGYIPSFGPPSATTPQTHGHHQGALPLSAEELLALLQHAEAADRGVRRGVTTSSRTGGGAWVGVDAAVGLYRRALGAVEASLAADDCPASSLEHQQMTAQAAHVRARLQELGPHSTATPPPPPPPRVGADEERVWLERASSEAVDNVVSNVSSLSAGIAKGFTGMFTKPIAEAQKGGAKGFIKGIGKGLFGAVTKPTTGVRATAPEPCHLVCLIPGTVVRQANVMCARIF